MSQKSKSDDVKGEFEPPPHKPRLNTYKSQLFLSSLIVIIPILALRGVFGETMDKLRSVHGPIDVTVEYPSQLRLKQRLSLSVVIKNISEGNLEDLQVGFDKEYINKFSDISATPAFDSIYEIHLGTLPPAGVTEVSLEFQGQKYGAHKGNVRIQSKTGPLQTLQVESFVFP